MFLPVMTKKFWNETRKTKRRISLLLKEGMGLKMNTFNIMRVHWKIRFLGGGFTKKQCIVGIP